MAAFASQWLAGAATVVKVWPAKFKIFTLLLNKRSLPIPNINHQLVLLLFFHLAFSSSVDQSSAFALCLRDGINLIVL